MLLEQASTLGFRRQFVSFRPEVAILSLDPALVDSQIRGVAAGRRHRALRRLADVRPQRIREIGGEDRLPFDPWEGGIKRALLLLAIIAVGGLSVGAMSYHGIQKGISVDEFVKAYRVPDKYKGFQADPQRVRANAEAIYNALMP